jgi:hypothetical protein
MIGLCWSSRIEGGCGGGETRAGAIWMSSSMTFKRPRRLRSSSCDEDGRAYVLSARLCMCGEVVDSLDEKMWRNKIGLGEV